MGFSICNVSLSPAQVWQCLHALFGTSVSDLQGLDTHTQCLETHKPRLEAHTQSLETALGLFLETHLSRARTLPPAFLTPLFDVFYARILVFRDYDEDEDEDEAEDEDEDDAEDEAEAEDEDHDDDEDHDEDEPVIVEPGDECDHANELLLQTGLRILNQYLAQQPESVQHIVSKHCSESRHTMNMYPDLLTQCESVGLEQPHRQSMTAALLCLQTSSIAHVSHQFIQQIAANLLAFALCFSD